MDLPLNLVNDVAMVDLNNNPQSHNLDTSLSVTMGFSRPPPQLATPVVNPKESFFTELRLHVRCPFTSLLPCSGEL
jgi:hypothetical protein